MTADLGARRYFRVTGKALTSFAAAIHTVATSFVP